MSDRLPAFALFGGLLAMAGLPIYLHAPKFYADQYGVSLTLLAAALFGLRVLDVVQDPVLAWLSRRLVAVRRQAVSYATAMMALAMLGLFAVQPPISPVIWFCLSLACLFSTYSFLTISFYAQGVATAERLGPNGHVRLAGWRETGALLGVSLAAVLPVAFVAVSNQPFAVFAVVFVALSIVAAVAMGPAWRTRTHTNAPALRPVLQDALARRLLLIAFLNAAPVAVSSTLFLFFVESRLQAPGWEGPLLVMFFLSAAAAAPVWSRLAAHYGAKPTLMLGMVLAILAFSWAAFLGGGDVLPFAVICVASGAALGADMTLLPAMFATRVSNLTSEAAEGFGIWSFVTKFSLAFAAVTLLPLLEAAGFQSGQMTQSNQALFTLTLSYAVLPCILKIAALLLLALTDLGAAKPALTRGT